MNHCLALALALAALSAPAPGGRCAEPAARPPQTSPKPPRKSALRIVEELTPKLMATYRVPGVSIAAIRDRRVAWERQFGVLCADGRRKVDRDTVFEACSMSKPVFAYVAMKLVEEGKLDLDASLAGYLDAPYLPAEPRHKAITARMVLSHTTGFPNWRKGGWREGAPLPLLFDPGTKFGYSGEGFLYLQRVVEHITKEPLKRIMRQRLLDPLGMKISSYAWQERFEKLAACGHDRSGKAKKRRRFVRANAAYSLYTTPREYASFLVEVMRAGRSAPWSLRSETVDAMLTRTVKATGREPVTRGGVKPPGPVFWGLGWPIDRTASGDRVYHGGANGTGFRCYSQFDRKRGTGIVIMTNALRGDELWRDLVAAMPDP